MRMGKIDTTTLLLIGGAAVAVYFLTRPKPLPPPALYPPNYQAGLYQPQANQTAQDITAGAGAASTLLNSISNMFG